MPSIKEFTEEAFAYFFSEVKNLENSKPLSSHQSSDQQSKTLKDPIVFTAEQKNELEKIKTKVDETVKSLAEMRTIITVGADLE